MSLIWQTTRFCIDLGAPKVMGIVNLTPDSFSDGGQHKDTAAALDHARQLLDDGADVLDVGGESTRPGAPAVSEPQEWLRLEPFLREAVRWQVPISVDTYKPAIMQRALDLGVDIVNDVWALQQAGALDVVAAHGRCGVCLMHMHREPQSMQQVPMQGDAVLQVREFLAQRLQAVMSAGVVQQRIVLDPGIGFGKTVAQNFSLLGRQKELAISGLPLLAGWSRKSAIGQALVRDGVVPPAAQRVAGSVAAALMAVERGASIVRVHDVKETVDALRVWSQGHGA